MNGDQTDFELGFHIWSILDKGRPRAQNRFILECRFHRNPLLFGLNLRRRGDFVSMGTPDLSIDGVARNFSPLEGCAEIPRNGNYKSGDSGGRERD